MEIKIRGDRTYEKITKKYSYSTLTEVIKGVVRQRGREKEKKKKEREGGATSLSIGTQVPGA